MSAYAVPVSAIINLVSSRLGKPIQDKTGLTGLYNWDLKWAPDESEVLMDGSPARSDPANRGPSLLTAVQEQLGLRLESSKVPIEILYIDHAERPVPN